MHQVTQSVYFCDETYCDAIDSIDGATTVTIYWTDFQL